MLKKLTIKTSFKPAVTIRRTALKAERLVYIAVANKSLKYQYGRSRIVYIGTTKAGAHRIAVSAASKARQMLKIYGVKYLDFCVVTCGRRQGVSTWQKLERALMLTFRSEFGEVPKCNTQGRKMKWRDEHDYFTDKRLQVIIDKYS